MVLYCYGTCDSVLVLDLMQGQARSHRWRQRLSRLLRCLAEKYYQSLPIQSKILKSPQVRNSLLLDFPNAYRSANFSGCVDGAIRVFDIRKLQTYKNGEGWPFLISYKSLYVYCLIQKSKAVGVCLLI